MRIARRELLAGLGGVGLTWPLRAQVRPSPVLSLAAFLPPGWPVAATAAPDRDAAPYLQQALDSLGPLGGQLFVPRGVYRLLRPVVLPARVTLIGEGRASTVFEVAHDGDGLRSLAPVNAHTPVNIELSGFGLRCRDNSATRGAGVFQLGGTYVSLRDVAIDGFRHGVILDQSELADIDLCQFEYQKHSGVWLVNGDDRTAGARTTFTNRISITRTQFNQPDRFCILDDGGFAHVFAQNNYNGGGEGHIRIAGYTQASILGSEFEGAGGPNIVLHNRSLDRARNVGRPEVVRIEGNIIAAAPGQPAIAITAVNALTVSGNLFGGAATPRTPAMVGLQNAEALFAAANAVPNPGGLTDGARAYRSHSVG